MSLYICNDYFTNLIKYYNKTYHESGKNERLLSFKKIAALVKKESNDFKQN